MLSLIVFNTSTSDLSALQQHQFSQEFQAVGSIPQFDYVFGLYYFNEHASEKAATPSSNRWNANGTGYTINSEIVVPPITSSNQGWDPSSWFEQRASRAEATSYSVFGQATWTPAFFEMAHLTAGGRYTNDKRDGVLYTVQNQEVAAIDAAGETLTVLGQKVFPIHGSGDAGTGVLYAARGIGALGYMIAGYGKMDLPPLSIGFVSLIGVMWLTLRARARKAVEAAHHVPA